MRIRPFNANKELKKIGKRKKTLPLFAYSGIALLVLTILISSTFAIYKINDRHNITNAIVGNISPTTLMVTDGCWEDSPFLDGPINCDQIKSITIANTKTVPGDAIGFWDVGSTKNGQVIAWYKSASGGKYDVWIGQDGGVKANPNSSYLFSFMPSVEKLELEYLNTTNVTDMTGMFYHGWYAGSPIKTLDLSNFNTTKVENMQHMFEGMMGLTNLNISGWDTSKVKDMQHMFEYVESLQTLDLRHFNTTNVVSMNSMFKSMNALKTLNVTGWNTSNVTDMSDMFDDVTSLTSLNLSSFNTGKLKDIAYMFSYSPNLTCIDMKNATFGTVTYYDSMFLNRNANLTVRVKDQAAKDWIIARDAGINATIDGHCYTSTGDLALHSNWGSTNVDTFWAVDKTSDGGYIAVGYATGNVSATGTGTALTNKGGFDAIIVKYNSAGTVEWQKNWGGTAMDQFFSVKQTSDSGYVAVGRSRSSSIAASGGGVALTGKGGDDAIIVKYDSTGNVVWQKNWGGASEFSTWEYFRDVQQTGDGGYIVIGSTDSDTIAATGTGLELITKDQEDAVLVKYNSSGTVVWQKLWGGDGEDNFESIQKTTDGGYIVAGFFMYDSVPAIDNGAPLAHIGNGVAMLVKYNSSGIVQWQKSWSGNNTDMFFSIQNTNDGGYIVAGRSSSTNIPGITNMGGEDGILIKYDSGGNVEWQKNWGGIGSGYFESVQQTSDGGYIVVGNMGNETINATGTGMALTSKGNDDAVIVKFNSTGTVVWQKNWGGAGEDNFKFVIEDSAGRYVAVGSATGNIPAQEGIPALTSKGGADAVIVKFN